ncbi:carbohydrate ABC transporter permease [Agromyces albus]|jgi:raffinose/stachyose/melibiose transport system permease protein|uniref:Carbohydrate ABC transporter permease n=1 Tax=Agromyces albus TaxID=205332 RepID=A0A4Q2L499_9MICO|nr:carbohydrate ABC transporter permease [Agromyces albus]MDQ0574388.1 raffinose/stachyose/melibiose transport system permease protein [Agromyces albus]RXZ73018.1 carbohydrate ABC transporter permease [Agromyces albus]
MSAARILTRPGAIATSLIMIPLAAVVGLPFYYVVVNTFKTQAETTMAPLALPTTLNLDNYLTVFSEIPVVQSFLNTVYVTAAAILLMLLIGSMAAFSVILRASRLVTVLLVIAFLVPGQVTLIPLYRMLSQAQLVDTLEGLIILYSGGSVFCYFLIVGYMRTLPGEVIEAARIDGAGPWQIYWRIALPLIRPILITVGVFQTMWVWNDFLTPVVFISSTEKQTLVLQTYKAVGEFTTDWPMFLTLSVVVLIPMVVFFIFMQRYIVRGLVAGSVKG